MEGDSDLDQAGRGRHNNERVLTEKLIIFRGNDLNVWCARKRWAKDYPRSFHPPFGRTRRSFVKIRKTRENANMFGDAGCTS